MPRFPPDETTLAVMELVAARFPDHFGAVDGFGFPVTPGQAAAALADFVLNRLPQFGDWQDTMKAGEATLFHALTGRVQASSGRIELDGRDITGTSDDDRVRLGIARSFQVTSLFPNLALRENLRLAAQALGRITGRVGVEEILDRIFATFCVGK